MFNWNEQDQVGGTLWGELSESEDHIVPHPKETEEDTLFTFGGYRKKQRNEGVNTDVRSTEQSSRAKTDFPSFKLENSSSFHINEELSASGIEMDTWLDSPNLCTALSDGCTDGNDHNSAVTELMNDLTDAPNLNSVRGGTMQLDGEPDLFGHEDKESDGFLDCDWATFEDFHDLDKIFRNNDSIFGHDMIDDADGFLSPSKDVINSTAQSIPMPDLPLCKDQTSEDGCSSVQLDEHSDKIESPFQKEKVDVQKVIPRSENKAEERRKNKPWKNLDAPSHNYDKSQQTPSPKLHISVTTPLQTFQPKAVSQQIQVGDAKPVEHLISSNRLTFTEHGYPTYYFPSIPLPPHVHVDRNQKRPVPAKQRKISNKLPNAKPVTMTPREKMEKLRRLQKMQALLAIQKQQQQYSHQITDDTVSQSCSQRNQSKDAMASTIGTQEGANMLPSSELNILAEQDEFRTISSLIDDTSVEEIIFYQLQDAVGKLDIRVRLCIRDSLFRLARSAMERQSSSDRSSTNKSNKDEDEVSADEESNNHDRSIRLSDSETDTNPIDRIVANLLFQRPTESCPRPNTNELPRSA